MLCGLILISLQLNVKNLLTYLKLYVLYQKNSMAYKMLRKLEDGVMLI